MSIIHCMTVLYASHIYYRENNECQGACKCLSTLYNLLKLVYKGTDNRTDDCDHEETKKDRSNRNEDEKPSSIHYAQTLQTY